jgi:hypothetical protein
MTILAAVLVQIIGLAVARTEPQLGGMHVVLPTVVTESSNVESHAPILVFKDADHVKYENQWPWHPFKPASGYSYVTLRGERVRFIMNGRNATATIPKELPHLKDSCTRMETLSDGYQPPAYGAAAAVVLLPRGDATACRMTSDMNGRIDTRVRMVNSGNFQVVAGNKSITLRDGAVIAIVNAPTEWIEGGLSTAAISAPHFNAYFAMAQTRSVSSKTCTLLRPAKVKTCPPLDFYRPPVNPADLPIAMHHLIAAAAPGGGQNPPDNRIPPKPMATFECSNTQWP